MQVLDGKRVHLIPFVWFDTITLRLWGMNFGLTAMTHFNTRSWTRMESLVPLLVNPDYKIILFY